MKYIKEICKNAKLSYSLDAKYYRITTLAGLLGVIVGMIILAYVVDFLVTLTGVDINAPIIDPGAKVLAGVGILFLLMVCLLLGMHICTGALSAYMYYTGKFTKKRL